MPKKKTPAETPESTPAAAPRRRTAAAKPKSNGAVERVQAGSDVVTVSVADDAGTPAAAPAASNGNTGAQSAPTAEQIAEAAYLRYLSRGGSHGQDFEDWIEAEKALRR